MKFCQILVCCMTYISNLFLAQCWRLENSSRLYYDFVKMTIKIWTWTLPIVLQIVQKIRENYCSYLYLSIGHVRSPNELWFKRYIQKCTLYHVLILMMKSQIWKIMGWLNIQKPEFLITEHNLSTKQKNS